MTKDIFKKGMTLFIAAYPDKDFNTDVFWMMWKDIGDEQFLNAVVKFCQTNKEIFPGTNIIACILELVFGDNEPLAVTAFGVLMTEVSRTGSYGVPKFDDPILAETVSAMGWRAICTSRTEDVAVLWAQFTKAYESIRKRSLNERITGSAGQIVQGIVKTIGQNKQISEKKDGG